MATIMLRTRCSVLRVRSNKTTNKKLTELAKHRFAVVPKSTLSVRSLLPLRAAVANLIKHP